MNLEKINEEIRGCEGVTIGDSKTLYVREDEVLRLILHFAYGVDYKQPEELEE